MMGRRHQGLRTLSADLVDKASDETDEQVVRLMLAFVGVAAFCLLSLASPDSGLLTGNEKLNVPGAGPVSFFGFMLLGPAILIVLRIYLQIYVEHSTRLDRIAQRMPVVRAPTLVPLKNPLILGFSALTFYLLLPVTMLFFAWKAAVFPTWGSGLLCVAAGAIASHATLPLRGVSWRTRALLSMGVAILAGGAILHFGPLRRPFDLYRANLSAASLRGYDLRGANLTDCNLTDGNLHYADLSGAQLINAKLIKADLRGAHLSGADLSGADLSGADLTGARLNDGDLQYADLSGANLQYANLIKANLRGAQLNHAGLSDADLSGADLSFADLSGAYLKGAKLDGQQQLNGACGADAKLPPGLTLKPCPP